MIPKKNNSGHTRLKIDKKTILKRNNYYFALAVVRRFMSEEQLKSFVALYDKHRSGPRPYVPKPSELKLFAEYTSGKITIEAFKEKMGCNHTAFYSKLGRLYAFSKK